MTIQTQIEIPHEALRDFCQRWGICELALFGSVLRSDFSPQSDIDILVSFQPTSHPTLFDLVTMEDELSAMFNRPIDLISKQAVQKSPNYIRRQAILGTAQVIYAE